MASSYHAISELAAIAASVGPADGRAEVNCPCAVRGLCRGREKLSRGNTTGQGLTLRLQPRWPIQGRSEGGSANPRDLWKVGWKVGWWLGRVAGRRGWTSDGLTSSPAIQPVEGVQSVSWIYQCAICCIFYVIYYSDIASNIASDIISDIASDIASAIISVFVYLYLCLSLCLLVYSVLQWRGWVCLEETCVGSRVGLLW